MANNYTRVVESFLDNDMSPGEREIFNEQLASDPLLQQEYQFQLSIIEGLRESRKAELKNRLSNIPVGVVFQSALLSSTAFKLITSVVLITLTGVGIFLLNTNPVNTFETISTTNGVTNYQLHFLNPTALPDKLDLVDNQFIQEKITELTSTPNEARVNNIAARAEVSVPMIDESLATENIDHIVPAIEKVSHVQDFEGTETLKNFDIKNIKSKKYDFHYKFIKGKLFLYGDFSGFPFDILEINNTDTKRLFLYHGKHYYRLTITQPTIQPLIKIENEKLIEELDILKEQKLSR